ncbi:MAG: BrnA antitoxin family protein [Eggerthellaceae bacterium]|nr:BrnA antitoxin family protein [Eggerthellaceae bacterium]
MGNDEMRAEYDFSVSKQNPYAKKLKKQITIRIDEGSIDYFKQQAAEVGIPYQSLINLYLADCAENRKELKLAWN